MATIRDVAEVLIKIDDKEAKTKMPELEKRAEELRTKWESCFKNDDQKGIKEAGKELRKVYREMDNLQKRTMDVDDAMQHLSTATPKELKRIMEQINRELNSGAIERGTKEWHEYNEKLKEVKGELKKIADEQKVVTDSGLSMKDMLDIGGNISLIASSMLELKDSIAGFMRDNVDSYVALDAEMANVQKFTGMARDEVESLNEDFKKIDTRTSIIELNKLAEEAGRLGKTSKEDVLGFVKAADVINVALDDLGEGATLEISKLTNIFGDEKALGTEKSMLAVGSVINELSQNCTAAAPYLANFTKRLAGVGAQADMTIPQIMGFAAVLDSQGQAVEMSATAVSQLITKMFQDPAKIAKAVGLDIQEFTNLVNTDTNAALLTLLERLNAFGSMDVLAPLFKEMGTDGARASAVLASLAGNVDMVRQQQELATQAYNEANSVIKEFNVQNTTEEAKLEKRRKKYEELKVELGEKLLPIMSVFASTTSFLVKSLLALINFVKEHHKVIISITAGLAAYTITVKAHTIAEKAATLATKAWNLVTKAATTLLSAGKIVVHASSLAYAKLTGNMVKATAAQKALNLAMKANPLGLLVGGITAAATALFSYKSKAEEAAEKERELAEERRRAAEEEKRRVEEMTDISQLTADNARKEITELERLYSATQNESLAKEERIAAAKELCRIYPEYFSQISTENILIGNAATQYEKLSASILKAAKMRAAQSKIEENYARIIEIEVQKEQYIHKRRQENAQFERRTYGITIDFDWADVKHGEVVPEELLTDENLKKYMTREKDGKRIWNRTAEEVKKSLDNTEYADDKFSKSLEELHAANERLAKIVNDNNAGGFEIKPFMADNTDDSRNTDNSAANWRDKENAINRTAYATGQIDYEEFLKKKHEILLEYYNKMLQDTSLSETKRLGILADIAEEEKNWSVKQHESALQRSLADIDKKYENARALETAWCYDIANENYGNEKILHEKLFQANVEYLKEKEQLYRSFGNNEEADKALLECENLVNNEKLRKQKEFLNLYEKLQKDYDKASTEEKMTSELEALDALHREGIVKDEEYQKLRKAIQEKYAKSGKFSDGGYGDMLTKMYTSIDTLISDTTDNTISSMEKIATVAKSTWAIAGAALEQYSAYSQACSEVEVAEVERKYDKMIAAAGKNSNRARQLEEKKEREIARVKTKYSKQAQKIEIAQAIAQTAVAAINAYASASKEHWLLGPIAAAMALAAGAIQIATINKQHQAQQAGYYTGGYTRKSANDREEVGVVHANEFVANAAATRNPALMPLLSLIDYAQKNNTVGNLTAADVSRAFGMGAVVKATSVAASEGVQNRGELLAVAGSINSNTKVVQRLNERLDEGIEAYMVMDGERGFDKRYSEYNRLKNNPKR